MARCAVVTSYFLSQKIFARLPVDRSRPTSVFGDQLLNDRCVQDSFDRRRNDWRDLHAHASPNNTSCVA